jgi:opacity protein-like surface antigen
MKSRFSFLMALCTLAMFCNSDDVSGADYDWMKKEDVTAVIEKKAKNQYVLVRGGWYLSDEPSGMNSGNGVEVGYGIQPLRWLAAEASAGYINADDYDDNLNNKHLTIQMVPVTATLRAILPFNQFDVYALAGGGMYYTMLKIDNINQDPGSDSSDKVLFGYHYGAGASVLLGGGSSVGAEVRQIVTKWDNLDISGTFVTGFFRLGF